MNDSVSEILKNLVVKSGIDLCTNRQRLEGLLRNYCGQKHRREINVLVAAVREKVAEDLMKVSGTKVDALVFHRLVRRLHEDAGIAEEFAEWAVSSWAMALGKGAPEIVSEAQPVAAKPVPKTSEVSETSEVYNPKDGAAMIYIPEGEFIMGSDKIKDRLALDGELPQRKVYLDGYWIYKYEVTVAQYRKFCKETGRQMPKPPSWGGQDNHPIEVTWYYAAEYCKWAGVELPTEAQWEKAARGTDGRIYPWGNVWDARKCNNYNTGPKQTTPVGSYPSGASPYGVLDMAGNVAEWCADWYDKKYYASAPNRNPQGPSSGQWRVLRGGSWGSSDPLSVRVAYRGKLTNYGGFRGVALRLPR